MREQKEEGGGEPRVLFRVSLALDRPGHCVAPYFDERPIERERKRKREKIEASMREF